MSDSKNQKVKNVHMAVGLDILGSKMSFQSGREYDLEVLSYGIQITKKSQGRIVIIPYSNIKGFELLSAEGAVTEGRMSAAGRQQQALSEARAAMAKKMDVDKLNAVPGPVLSVEEQKEAADNARKEARRIAKEAGEKALQDRK